jgi:hypothetical protein
MGDVPLLQANTAELWGKGAQITTTKVSIGRTDLGGTFSLNVAGSATAEVPYNVDALGLKSALEALPSIAAATVTRTTHPVVGFVWNVTFTGLAGDVALLGVNTNRLHGADVSGKVATLVQGGSSRKMIDGTFIFSSSLGDDYTGAWETPSKFVLSILNVSVASRNSGFLQGNRVYSTALGATTWAYQGKYCPLFVLPSSSHADQCFKHTTRNGYDSSFGSASNVLCLNLDSCKRACAGLPGCHAFTTHVSHERCILNTAKCANDASARVSSANYNVFVKVTQGLSVVIPASSGLHSADMSSPTMTASRPVLGSWGPHAPPQIVSATASNDGAQSGFGNGDRVTIVFDKDTNAPAVSTKSAIDQLVSFSTAVGQAYTAAWVAASSLVITFSDTTGAATKSHTRVGDLNITIRGGLRSIDLSSEISTGTVIVEGTWGDAPAPKLLSAVAADTGLKMGIGSSDTITLTFDTPTNSPSVSTKADLDKIILFSASLGNDYNAEWAWDRLPGSVTTTQGSSSVQTSTDLTTKVQRGDEVRIGAYSFVVHSFLEFSATKLPTDRAYAGSGVANTAIFKRSRLKMVVNLRDTSGAGTRLQTRTGALKATMRASGSVKSEDGSSAASNNAVVLGGTWGVHSAPEIVSVTASDSGNQPGIGDGDTITVVFDRATNQPLLSRLQEVQVIESKGSGVVGEVASEIQSLACNAASGTLRLRFLGESTEIMNYDATAAELEAALKALPSIVDVGVLFPLGSTHFCQPDFPKPATVTFRNVRGRAGDMPLVELGTSTLRGGTANVYITRLKRGAASLSGTFNLATSSAPTIKTNILQHDATASQVKGALEALSSISTPLVVTRVGPSLAGGYRWLVTFVGVKGDVAPLTVPVNGLVGNDASIGVREAIKGANRGMFQVFNPDTFRFELSLPVVNLSTCFRFSPTSLGDNIEATWSDATTAVIRIGDGSGVTSLKDSRVGSLVVSVLTQCGITSEDLSSPSSSSSATVTSGSWGAHPAPSIRSFVASDAGEIQPGLGPGDTLNIIFDRDTSIPAGTPLSTTAAVNAMFAFSAPIGLLLQGSWLTSRQVMISIYGVEGAGDLTQVRVGTLQISTKLAAGIRSADLSSPATTAGATLTGSWGSDVFVSAGEAQVINVDSPEKSASATLTGQVFYDAGKGVHVNSWELVSALQTWSDSATPPTAPSKAQVVISGPASLATQVTGLVPGLYTFRLTATAPGPGGSNSTSDVTIRINTPPVVIVTSPVKVELPANEAVLSATDSRDTDSGLAAASSGLKFKWSITKAPPQSTAALAVSGVYLANATTMKVTGLSAIGDYLFKVEAIDMFGGKSDMSIDLQVFFGGGVTVSRMSLAVSEGNALTDSFTVVLKARPQSNVTLNITQTPSSAGIVTIPARATFSPSTWNIPRTITVSAPRDDTPNNHRTGTLTIQVESAADANYGRVPLIVMPVVVTDVPASDTPPPMLKSAQFGDAGRSITVVFDRGTDKGVGQLGSKISSDCTPLFRDALAQPTTGVGLLGIVSSPPSCAWVDLLSEGKQLGQVLRITLGASATVVPGSALTLRGDTVRNIEKSSTVAAPEQTILVASPANPTPPQVTLTGQTDVGICDTVHLEAIVEGGGSRAPKYAWSLLSSTEQQPAALSAITQALAALNAEQDATKAATFTLTLPSGVSLSAGTTIAIRVTATDFLGLTGKADVFVTQQAVSVPRVRILTASDATRARVDSTLEFSVKATPPPQCTGHASSSLQMTTSWREVSGLVDMSTWPALKDLSGGSPNVVIPAYALVVGKSYEFEVTVTTVPQTTGAPTVSSKASVAVTVAPSPLVVEIAGGSSAEVGQGSSFTLDGSGSTDPDIQFGKGSIGVQFAWTCVDEEKRTKGLARTNTTLPVVTTCLGAGGATLAGLAETTTTVTFPANTFAINSNFEFKLTIRKGTRTAHTTTRIRVVAGTPPVVDISTLPGLVVNADDRIIMGATTTPQVSTSSQVLSTSWRLVSGPIAGITAVATAGGSSNIPLAYNLTSLFGPKLVVRPNALVPGAQYTFKFEATDDGGSASAEVSFRVNTPPSTGKFAVLPSAGVAGETPFDLRFSLWADEDLPLKYSLSTKTAGSAAGSAQTPMVTLSREPSTTQQLPLGDSAKAYALMVVGTVQDAYGAKTTREVAVTVGLPTADMMKDGLETYIGGKTTALEEIMQSGDANAVMSGVGVLASIMNDPIVDTTVKTIDGRRLQLSTGVSSHRRTLAKAGTSLCGGASACSSHGACTTLPLGCTGSHCESRCLCSKDWHGQYCHMSASTFSERIALRSKLLSLVDQASGLVVLPLNPSSSALALAAESHSKRASLLASVALYWDELDNSTWSSVAEQSKSVATAVRPSNWLDNTAGALVNAISAVVTAQRWNYLHDGSAHQTQSKSISSITSETVRCLSVGRTVGSSLVLLGRGLLDGRIPGEAAQTAISVGDAVRIAVQRVYAGTFGSSGIVLSLPAPTATTATTFTVPKNAKFATSLGTNADPSKDPHADVVGWVLRENPYTCDGGQHASSATTQGYVNASVAAFQIISSTGSTVSPTAAAGSSEPAMTVRIPNQASTHMPTSSNISGSADASNKEVIRVITCELAKIANKTVACPGGFSKKHLCDGRRAKATYRCPRNEFKTECLYLDPTAATSVWTTAATSFVFAARDDDHTTCQVANSNIKAGFSFSARTTLKASDFKKLDETLITSVVISGWVALYAVVVLGMVVFLGAWSACSSRTVKWDEPRGNADGSIKGGVAVFARFGTRSWSRALATSHPVIASLYGSDVIPSRAQSLAVVAAGETMVVVLSLGVLVALHQEPTLPVHPDCGKPADAGRDAGCTPARLWSVMAPEMIAVGVIGGVVAMLVQLMCGALLSTGERKQRQMNASRGGGGKSNIPSVRAQAKVASKYETNKKKQQMNVPSHVILSTCESMCTRVSRGPRSFGDESSGPECVGVCVQACALVAFLASLVVAVAVAGARSGDFGDTWGWCLILGNAVWLLLLAPLLALVEAKCFSPASTQHAIEVTRRLDAQVERKPRHTSLSTVEHLARTSAESKGLPKPESKHGPSDAGRGSPTSRDFVESFRFNPSEGGERDHHMLDRVDNLLTNIERRFIPDEKGGPILSTGNGSGSPSNQDGKGVPIAPRENKGEPASTGDAKGSPEHVDGRGRLLQFAPHDSSPQSMHSSGSGGGMPKLSPMDPHQRQRMQQMQMQQMQIQQMQIQQSQQQYQQQQFQQQQFQQQQQQQQQRPNLSANRQTPPGVPLEGLGGTTPRRLESLASPHGGGYMTSGQGVWSPTSQQGEMVFLKRQPLPNIHSSMLASPSQSQMMYVDGYSHHDGSPPQQQEGMNAYGAPINEPPQPFARYQQTQTYMLPGAQQSQSSGSPTRSPYRDFAMPPGPPQGSPPQQGDSPLGSPSKYSSYGGTNMMDVPPPPPTP